MAKVMTHSEFCFKIFFWVVWFCPKLFVLQNVWFCFFSIWMKLACSIKSAVQPKVAKCSWTVAVQQTVDWVLTLSVDPTFFFKHLLFSSTVLLAKSKCLADSARWAGFCASVVAPLSPEFWSLSHVQQQWRKHQCSMCPLCCPSICQPSIVQCYDPMTSNETDEECTFCYAQHQSTPFAMLPWTL